LERSLSERAFLRILAWKNYWLGEPELRILSTFVHPNAVAFDIGANRGIYTYLLSRLANRVVAFEPNPELARRLRSATGPNVTVVEVALSDRPGRGTLEIPAGVQGDLSHGYGRLVANKSGHESASYQVELARLDDWKDLSPGFIKIDVEGHEDSLLAGGERLLEQARPVCLVEMEERHRQRPIQEALDRMRGMGFLARSFDGKTLRCVETAAELVSNNVFFVPRERADP
jgi:FkbM family methyltransferase